MAYRQTHLHRGMGQAQPHRPKIPFTPMGRREEGRVTRSLEATPLRHYRENHLLLRPLEGWRLPRRQRTSHGLCLRHRSFTPQRGSPSSLRDRLQQERSGWKPPCSPIPPMSPRPLIRKFFKPHRLLHPQRTRLVVPLPPKRPRLRRAETQVTHLD